jgi:hypothetical protein
MAKSEIQGLSGLIIRRFFLQLKDAVFSELAENWKGGVGFKVDEINEESWLRFLDGVCRRMEMPDDWHEDLAVLGEFESLVVDAVREFQRES